jgi:hypothetical protein
MRKVAVLCINLSLWQLISTMAASASSHSQNVTCCKAGIQVNFKEEERKKRKTEKKTGGPLVGTSPNPPSHPQAKRSPPSPQSSHGKK